MLRHIAAHLGERLFRTLLTITPARLWETKSDELFMTFRDGMVEAKASNLWSVISFSVTECIGLVYAASRVRKMKPVREVAMRHRPGVSPFNVVRDVQFALRQLRRQPGNTLLVMLTFAAGVGASSSMLGLIDTVLLRPLPFPDPEELVSIYPTIPEWIGQPTLEPFWDRGSFSYPEYVDWMGTQTSFVSTAVLGSATATLTGNGSPQRIQMARATWQLFPMLGVPPLLGRLLTPEDQETGERIVILTEEFWRTRFGADSTIIGGVIDLSDTPYTVVGVLPRWFKLEDRSAVAWTNLRGSELAQRDNHNLRGIGRLKQEVTLAEAQAESATILANISAPDDVQHGANLVPRLQDVTRTVRTPLTLLVFAAAVLLAIACINVAALLLGIGIEREREFTIRGALGAGRGRIVRQLLTENLLLATVGGVVGVAATYAGTQLLVALAPQNIPRLEQAGVDVRIVLLTLGISMVSGIIFSLIPAVSLSQTDASKAMQGDRLVPAGKARLQSVIVVGELVLVTVLLMGAGLLTRTLFRLNTLDVGFDQTNLLTLSISPSFVRYGSPGTGPLSYENYIGQVVEQLASLPGVESVGTSSIVPFAGRTGNNPISIEGYETRGEERLTGERHFVSPNYLDMMRITVLEGRNFNSAENHASAEPVVIVNEALARLVASEGGAIGKRFTFWDSDYTIVGVVNDVRQYGLTRDPGFQFYALRGQRPGQWGDVVMRVASEPTRLIPAIRERVWAVDPDVPITRITTMEEQIHGSLADQRYRARLMLTFSSIAILMALLGVYGVTARTVTRRTRELGIRVALGAERKAVMSLVLGLGLKLALAGGIIGLGVSLATNRALESMLFGTPRMDPMTVVLVVLIVGCMSLIASLAPALRATRIDPLLALRAD